MFSKTRIIGALGAMLLGLGACGGGGGGGTQTAAAPQTTPTTPTNQPTGIEGTGRVISRGAISAFGSIFVNGVEYATDKARIEVDGRVVAQADLALGEVVTVVGTLNAGGKTAAAETVSFAAPIVGRVQSLDRAAATLVVLGQPVRVDGSTRFGSGLTPASLEGVLAGDELQVSGFQDSRGAWVASSIARRSAGQSLAATGSTAAVDASRRRLTVGALVVDWTAAQLIGFGTRLPVDGDFVRVEGASLSSGGELVATRLALVDRRLPLQAGDNGHLQGNVTRFASATDFDVDGYRVTTDSNTKFNSQDPAGFGGLKLDRFVTVRGVLLADGRLLATDILTTNLVTINAALSNSTPYEIEYAGRSCLTAATSYSIDGRAASWSDVRAGDVATLLQSFGATEPLRCHQLTINRMVRGAVESIDAARGRLTVLGQAIAIAPGTHVLESDGARSIDALTTLIVGDLVEASGYRTADGTIAATRVDRASSGAPRQVVGVLVTVDPSARRASVGALTIDYSSATPSGFPSSGPAAGQRVVVRGTQGSAGTLLASSFEYDSPQLRGTENGPAHIFGPITGFRAANDFDVEGRNVRPAPDNGVVAGPDWECTDQNLALDAFVTTVTAAQPLPGLTSFYRVRTWFGEYGSTFGRGRLEIEGTVESVDASRRSMRVAGVDVTVQPLTALRTTAAGASCPAPTTVAKIAVGSGVRIGGAPGPGRGSVLAASVDNSPGTMTARAHFDGNVESLLPDGLIASGQRIRTDATTRYANCGAVVAADEFVREAQRALAGASKPDVAATTANVASVLTALAASDVETCIAGTGRSGVIRARVASVGADALVLDVPNVRIRIAGPATGIGDVAAGQFVSVPVRWDSTLADLYVVEPITIVDRAGTGVPSVAMLPDAYRRPDVVLLGKAVATTTTTEFVEGGVASDAGKFFGAADWSDVTITLERDTAGGLVAKKIEFAYLDYGW